MHNLIPLIEVLPNNKTDAECRVLLRNSHKWLPRNGRWLFTRREAPQVQRYLSSR